jgi:hypothetical protein
MTALTNASADAESLAHRRCALGQNSMSLTGFDVKRTSRTAAVDVAVGRIPVVRGSCAYVRVAPEVKSFREFESRVCLTHLLTLEGFRLNTPNLIEPTLERIRIHSREIWNAPNQ